MSMKKENSPIVKFEAGGGKTTDSSPKGTCLAQREAIDLNFDSVFGVHRSCFGPVIHPSHESEFGGDLSKQYSRRYAGTRLFLPQHFAIFTIPIGFLPDDVLADKVFEKAMKILL